MHINLEPKDSHLEEAKLCKKFHDEYLSIFENNDADR